jgi:hypothetical protein
MDACVCAAAGAGIAGDSRVLAQWQMAVRHRTLHISTNILLYIHMHRDAFMPFLTMPSHPRHLIGIYRFDEGSQHTATHA